MDRSSGSPGRSPDVFSCALPYWIEGGTASHGQPYAYDARVPLLFLGAGIAPRRVFRPVDIRDLAATMSAVLGSAPPSACSGAPLDEVAGSLRAKRRSF